MFGHLSKDHVQVLVVELEAPFENGAQAGAAMHHHAHQLPPQRPHQLERPLGELIVVPGSQSLLREGARGGGRRRRRRLVGRRRAGVPAPRSVITLVLRTHC